MRGFTLLEVLIAMAILVVIGSAVYTSYISNVETIRAGRSKSEVHQRARIILDVMAKDLESAINVAPSAGSVQPLGMIGTNGSLDRSPADRIDFTTVTHLAFRMGEPKTDLCSVGYRVGKGEEGQFVLYRRDDGFPGQDIAGGGREEELSDMITGLDIIYVDSRGRASDEWDSFRKQTGDGLPTLIRITLILRDPDAREHVFRSSVHPEFARRWVEG
ncbi:MAG: prepilin-type N-terminal cleavage/methylation domain-containing protein [Thermodesulfobacteriota bacterium]